MEDIPTPEGVLVYTPGTEVSSTPVAFREVCTSNLPSVQLRREIYALMHKNQQIFKSDLFRTENDQMSPLLRLFNMSDQLSSQLSICNSFTSKARSLQIDLRDIVCSVMSSTLRDTSSEKAISLASYFPPDDTDNDWMLGSYGLDVFGIKLLQYFIGLTNKGTIYGSQLEKGIKALITILDESFLFDLLSWETTMIRTFMRKILPTLVDCGNTRVVNYILKKHSDILNVTNHRYRYGGFTQQEICMSIAVTNGDNPMVALLCTAGFSPQILDPHASLTLKKLPWDTGNLETLQTLLSFGANPECFIVGRPRGYPLIDAAKSGNLEAINILLRHGSEVDCYVKDYFGTALQAAVWAGNLEMVEFLVAYGADINAPFGTQYQLPVPKYRFLQYEELTFWEIMTPIQIACAKDNVLLAVLLLSHGADANFSPLSQIDLSHYEGRNMFSRRDKSGSINYSPHYNKTHYLTALQHSVRNGNIDLVQLLLLRGANPNSRATRHQWEDTPLQLSIRLDHSDIARILIDSGANVNASPGEFNGRTALQAAAESGNIQIAKELLSRGADINAPPAYEKGLTALQAAIKMGHSLMAGALCILGANIDAPPAPRKGLTAIEAAAETGDLDLVNGLIRYGADVKNATAGTKAMLASISHKSLPMLELLVKCGAPINLQKDDDDIPPIVASAKKGWIDGVRYLLDNGANINLYYHDEEEGDNYDEEEDDSISALAWSINNHDIRMIDLLLTRGASLHIPSAEHPYNDSLCLALHQGCPVEIINRLIDQYAEADPFFLDQEVLAEAVCNESSNDQMATTTTILSVMSKLPKALYVAQLTNAWNRLSVDYNETYATDEDAIEVIKLLLKAGADINSRHPVWCCTFLQGAIGFGSIELARFLIEEGAEIQAPSSVYRGTPLQEAIRNNETEFAHYLLERVADINAPPAENWGTTALQAAARIGNKSLVMILLERGAELNAPPAKDGGVTALQAAAITGYIDIAGDLLQYGAQVSAPGASENGRTAIDGAAEHGNEDMLQLLLNHYDGCDDLSVVCERAATYAEKEGHGEIALWLRHYSGH